MANKIPIVLTSGELREILDSDILLVPALDVEGDSIFNSDAGNNDFIINQLTSGIAYQYDANLNFHGWGRGPTTEFDMYRPTGVIDLLLETGGGSQSRLLLKNSNRTWEVSNSANGDFKIENNNLASGEANIFINANADYQAINIGTGSVVFNNNNYDIDFIVKGPREIEFSNRSVTAFINGEDFTASPSGATGTVYTANGKPTGLMRYTLLTGTITTADSLTGDVSGATCDVDTIENDPEAYQYTGGNGRHGWNITPNVDFHFFQKQGTLDFRCESGDPDSVNVDFEFMNVTGTWLWRLQADGDYVLRDETDTQDILEFKPAIGFKAINFGLAEIDINPGNNDYDFIINKLTSGSSFDYDAGNDETQIGTVGTNFSKFEADGTLEFNGDATVWDDVNLGGATLGGNPSVQPDIVEIDGSSGGTSVYTYGFDTGEAVSGILEIPHWYKEGSDFVMHVHISGNSAPTGTDKIKFELEYFTVKSETVIGASTTISVEGDYDTQYERINLDFPTVSGTGHVMGEQLGFTLRRVAASADEYAGDALLHTVGGHFEKDTMGSRQITTK